MVLYKNYFICIFMNINKYLKRRAKALDKLVPHGVIRPIGDYFVPNVLSPRDLVYRSDNMDETVLSSYGQFCSYILLFFL